MNGINRRGQKVVCVVGIEYESGLSGRIYPGLTPELDEVYTVRDFISPHDGVVLKAVDIDIPLDAFIELEEMLSPSYVLRSGAKGTIGWPLACFRPVQTRETDIGDLRRLLIDRPLTFEEANEWLETTMNDALYRLLVEPS